MGTKNQPTEPSADKPQKHPTDDTSSAVVVSSVEKNPFRRIPGLSKFHSKTNLPKYIVYGVAALIVLGLVSFGGYKYWVSQDTIPTEEEAIQQNFDLVTRNEPSKDASNDKKSEYYKQLMGAQLDIKDYKGAVDSFQKREAIDSKSLAFYDYIAISKTYHDAGKNDEALKALDTAEKLMPKTADEKTGYFPDLTLADIDNLRQEYKK